MMCAMGLFSVMLILFYAGYITGKKVERIRFEKRIKRGFLTLGDKLYFCNAPYVAAITHIRDATQEEIDDYVQGV